MKRSLLIALVLALLVGINARALMPIKEYRTIPDALHLPYQNNTITTEDGVKLKSWTLLPSTGRDNKVTLVLAYADAGNMSWWLQRGQVFAEKGYTVVLFDYRGFGGSDDFKIDHKMLYYNEFATDLEAAIKFAKEKYKGNKTGVLCYSMGTVVTTLAAAKAKPDFIIGEGYVTDPVAIVAENAKKNKQLSLPKGADKYKAALEKLNTRMLVFSGSEDPVTTDDRVQELKKKKHNIEVVGFKGGHMGGFDALSQERTGSEYVKAVNKFLGIN